MQTLCRHYADYSDMFLTLCKAISWTARWRCRRHGRSRTSLSPRSDCLTYGHTHTHTHMHTHAHTYARTHTYTHAHTHIHTHTHTYTYAPHANFHTINSTLALYNHSNSIRSLYSHSTKYILIQVDHLTNYVLTPHDHSTKSCIQVYAVQLCEVIPERRDANSSIFRETC
jgi:hypothetical protein